MSRDIRFVVHNIASPTLYGCIFEPETGYVYRVATGEFEAWGTGGRTAVDYDITITHRGGSVWTLDIPAALPAGLYTVCGYQQAGSSPADSDLMIAKDTDRWTGTEWQGAINFVSSVPS